MRFAVGFWLHPYWGADAIWAAFGSSAVVSLLLTMLYYWHGGWRKLQMVAAPVVKRHTEI
jgi:Na+-driven multidrug efflux pump